MGNVSLLLTCTLTDERPRGISNEFVSNLPHISNTSSRLNLSPSLKVPQIRFATCKDYKVGGIELLELYNKMSDVFLTILVSKKNIMTLQYQEGHVRFTKVTFKPLSDKKNYFFF